MCLTTFVWPGDATSPIRRILPFIVFLFPLLSSRSVCAAGFTISGGSVTLANQAQLATVSDLVINSGSFVANQSTITVGGSWTNNGGSFSAGTSTVTLTAASSGKTVTSKGSPFYILTFNGSGGYWTLQDSMTALSNLNVTAGTLDTNSSNQAISLGGNWITTGGNFTANQSTVTLNGTTGQVINNFGQAFAILLDSNTSTGGVTFASSFTATALTINGAGLASATTVYFNANSTYTITGLTLVGTSGGKTVFLRTSQQNGQSWYLNNTSTNSIAWVDVKDSNASAGVTIAAGQNSIDSGNNVNWTFLILSVSLGAHSYDFGSVDMAATTISNSALTVTNSGNVTETYALSVATTGAKTVWAVATATPTAADNFVLLNLFNSVQPSSNTFSIQDIVTNNPATGTGSVFAGDQNAVSIPVNGTRQLWSRLDMPLTTSTTDQQQMNLTVTATTP